MEQRLRRDEREVDGEVGEHLLVLHRPFFLEHREQPGEERLFREPGPRRVFARGVIHGEELAACLGELHDVARRVDPAELLRATHHRRHAIVVHPQVLGELEHRALAPGQHHQVVEQTRDFGHVHAREGDEPLGRGGDRLGEQRRGENRVQPVHHRLELGAPLLARVRQRVHQLLAHPPGVRGEHDDPAGEEHRLLHAVGHDDQGVDSRRGVPPQIHHLAAQVFGGERVERPERLVHEHDLGRDGQRAREAHALLHAARKLLRVRGLEPLETHEIDGAGDRVALRATVHAPGIEAHCHVLRDREPGQQGERLEHHRGGTEHAVQWLAAIQHRPFGRACEPGEQPQQGALAAPRRPHQCDDLVLAYREVHVAQRLQDLPIGQAEALGHMLCFE